MIYLWIVSRKKRKKCRMKSYYFFSKLFTFNVTWYWVYEILEAIQPLFRWQPLIFNTIELDYRLELSIIQKIKLLIVLVCSVAEDFIILFDIIMKLNLKVNIYIYIYLPYYIFYHFFLMTFIRVAKIPFTCILKLKKSFHKILFKSSNRGNRFSELYP